MRTGLFSAQMASQAMAATSAGERATRTASEARLQTRTLKYDVEKLFMITEALWAILKEQHGYSDEKLEEMIETIDLRDGKLDGKVAKRQKPVCPQCGRTLMNKHPVCLYCGTAVVRDPFER